MELGYDHLVILEARDRVGGRIHTRHSGDNGASPPATSAARFPEAMDLGAAWVHGIERHPVPNPMLNYIRSSDLLEIAPGNPWMRPLTVMHMGRRGEEEDAKYALDQPKQRLLRLFHRGKCLDTDERIVQKAISRHFHLMKVCVPKKAREFYGSGRGLQTASTSLQETIDDIEKTGSVDADERVHILARFYRHLITTWYGKSPSRLQLANFTADEDIKINDRVPPDWTYDEEGDFRGPHCLVKGGMSTLLEPMLEKVGKKVILEQNVKEIWKEGNMVWVRTVSGENYVGMACVVTLPVSCLRDDLPTLFPHTPITKEKKEALQHLSLGSYKKVLILFDRIFWPAEPPFLGLMRDKVDPPWDIGESLLIDNLWAARQGQACLEAILVGDAADWATHRDDIEIRDAVLDFMREAFEVDKGDLYNWYVDCHVTRWEEDPFSRGAYASLSLGALPRHVDAMNKPEWDGTLVFAGEAVVDDFEGSVHAALFSGISAATKISRFLSTE